MANSLFDHFVVINPQKSAVTEPCDAGLYNRLERNFNGFKGHELVSAYIFEENWQSWERHPNGDEIIVLLSGEIDIVLRQHDAEQQLTLNKPGTFTIIPRNTWHTASVNTRCEVLFITPGEGTEHSELSRP